MGHTVDVELSRFAAELAWTDLPERTRSHVVDIWADMAANALAGRGAAAIPAVERLATSLTGPGDSTVIGGGATSMTGAVLVNGYQITAFTMCDVYRPALCHITPEVVPPLLALAERRRTSGRDLLAAFAVGLEVTARLGLGVDYPVFRARGWHAPGVIGAIGAAAAAARLLGLGDDGIRRAIGLGLSQASGTFAALGTPAVKFHQARGAVSGLWAALFAAEGLGGAEHAISHPDGGLLAAFADGGAPELIRDGLGDRWELEQVSLRRWPAASSLQSLVACLVELADHRQLSWSEVEAVEIGLPPASYAMCAEMGWADELSAMQSARFVTAAVLRDRRCWTEQFDRAHRADPDLGSFAGTRVAVRRDPGLPPSGVAMVVRPAGQAPIELRRAAAPGEPAEPLSRRMLREKLAAACAATAVADPARLEALLFGVERLPDVRDLTGALRATPAEGRTHEFAAR